MSSHSNAQRLAIVSEAEELNSELHAQAIMPEVVVCSFCFVTGIEVVTGKGARRCKCRARDVQAKLVEATRIPRRYSECSLSNYQPASNNGSQLRAFNYAYRLVREYPSVDRELLLIGPCGVGKTHLAAAILRGLIESPLSVLRVRRSPERDSRIL